MKSLYTVIFQDGSNFQGGTFSDTKWTEIPNKPIKRIIYNLQTGDKLVLNHYDNYFHMIEATTDFYLPSPIIPKDVLEKKEITKLEYAYIMGRRNNIVICYKIDLKTGDIERKIFDEEDNFIKKLNENGWK